MSDLVKSAFSGDKAKNYDKDRAHGAIVKEALHYLMRAVFGEMPENARFLCVGAGTGDELFALAEMYPKAHFTVVEPSEDMMVVCREKAEKREVADRCHFHCGYLASLEAKSLHHGATSILVSHFLTDERERKAFFRSIADQLVDGGVLVNVDLSTDISAPTFAGLYEAWGRMLHGTDMPEEMAEGFLKAIGRDVAVSPADTIEKIMEGAGFSAPISFFQSLLMRGWFTFKQ